MRSIIVLAILGGAALAHPLGASDPALASRWVAYGQKLYAARQYDPALKAFSAAARSDAADAAAWRGLGNVSYAKRDYASALKYYRYALKLSPGDAALASFVQKLAALSPAHGAGGDPLSLAIRFYQAGQYQEAVQHYQAAVSAEPQRAAAYQGLGNSYHALGDKPQAVKAYRKAMELDPSNVALKDFLARYDPDAAQAAGVAVVSGPKDWAQPLWRSAILPGWGQAYNGSSGKAWLLGGITVGALVGTLATYMAGDAARRSYEGLSDDQADYDGPYQAWSSMATYNHVFALTFLAAYSLELVDAVLGAKAPTHAASTGPGPVELGYYPALGGPGLKVRLLQF